MVGPPKLDAAQAKKRNAMVVKTRKAESVSMGPGSSLTSSSASALQFGALQSRSVFVAYEEIIRGTSCKFKVCYNRGCSSPLVQA